MEPVRLSSRYRRLLEKIIRARCWKTVEEEIDWGRRYRARIAASRPTLDEIVNASRTPNRKPSKEHIEGIDSNEDVLAFAKEYKTAREDAEEQAEKKLKESLRKMKKKRKPKCSLPKELPVKILTEYEKWALDPHLYEKEKRKKEELRKKQLKKERKERQKRINRNFLEEEEFKFLMPIDKNLTIFHRKKLVKQSDKKIRLGKKLMEMLESANDPNKPVSSKKMSYCMRLGVRIGFYSVKNKTTKGKSKPKKEVGQNLGQESDVSGRVATSKKPIAFEKLLDIQESREAVKPRTKSKNKKSKIMKTEENLTSRSRKKSKNTKKCSGAGDQLDTRKGKEITDKSKSKKQRKEPSCEKICKCKKCKKQLLKMEKGMKQEKRKYKMPKGEPNRELMSQSQYDKYLARPRTLPQPPKEKQKKKRDPLFTLCSRRLEELARPNKRIACENLKLYAQTLPMESVACLEKILEEPKRTRPLSFEEAEKVFKLMEKRKKKDTKEMKKKAMRPFETWLKEEIAILTDAFLMVMVKSSPKEFSNHRMQLSGKVFRVARVDYHLKIKKPNRNSKNLGKKLLLNVADVIASWADVTYTVGQSMVKHEWHLQKKHKTKRRVQLPPSIILEPGQSISSSELWASTYSEGSTIDIDKDILKMIEKHQETMVETILRILKSGNFSDLETPIHKHLLSDHTYMELLNILEGMAEKQIILEEKTTDTDVIDDEIEDALMTWAFTHREPVIGAHELITLSQFSRHIMDLFGVDKEQFLFEEQDKKTDELWRRENLPTIAEGEAESVESLDQRKFELFIDDKLKFKEASQAGLAEASEGETQGSESVYGIASKHSHRSTEYGSEEGDETDFIGRIESQIQGALENLSKKDLDKEKEKQELEERGEYEDGIGDEYIEGGIDEDHEEDYEQEGKDFELPEIAWDEEVVEDHVEEEEEVVHEKYEPKSTDIDSLTGHPSSIHEHSDDTVCCVVIRKYAEWVYSQSVFLEKWNTIYNKLITALREFEDHKIIYGFHKLDKEKFLTLEKRITDMINILKRYRDITEHVGDSVFATFQGKSVICCAKCLEENRLPEIDDDPAHEQMKVLIENIREMIEWDEMLQEIVEPEDILLQLRLCLKRLSDNEKRERGKEERKKKALQKSADAGSIIEITEIKPDDSDDTFVINIEEL